MSTTAHWSFAGRMMRLYLVGTVVMLVIVGLTGYLLLGIVTRRALDEVTARQVKVFRVEYEKLLREMQETPPAEEGLPAQGPRPLVVEPRELELITVEIASRLQLPSAWRVWTVEDGAVMLEAGRLDLLAPQAPALEPLSTTRALETGQHWRSEPLSHGLVVGIVVDGSEMIDELHGYQFLAGAPMVLAAMASLGLGAYMIQRMTSMLRRVAASARAIREPTAETVELEVTDAPDEIREVVEALRELFGKVRAEADRNRVFYASMAHELRSPIQNLVGETEVALFTQHEGADYRRVLESNLDELRSLGDAIDNLVTICSERRPGTSAGLEDFDLLEEARIRLARERAQAARRQVELRLEGEGDLSLRGDREALLRALRNLAANAIQWSPQGATVSVHLRDRGGELEVVVDDAGPGVPEELREHIFEPFARGPALDGQRIGYGLGLAIVRAAVDAHGGEIEICRSPRGGARFRLRLPRTARPRAESRKAPAPEEGLTGRAPAPRPVRHDVRIG